MKHPTLPTNFKAALIDMDGTLYDSMPYHVMAWNKLTSELGMDVDKEEMYQYEGMTGNEIVKALYQKYLHLNPSDAQIREAVSRKAHYFQQFPPVPVMPGAREMLQQLKRLGKTIILVTGSSQNTLLNRLDTDFPDTFKLRVTSDSVKRCKPFPDPFLHGAELAGVSPQECIAVDNAPLGVTSAHSAGTFTIGVTTGPISQDTMKAAGADAVIPSVTSLAQALSKM